MKKCNKSIASATIVLMFSACVAQKKAAYEFPIQMRDEIRVQYVQLADKGRVLYDINCSGCHNVRIHGRNTIPDFSPEKLVGYELRVQNGQHEAAMPDTKVTAEELSLISTFLTYKKKSGITSMPKI